jgi:hypothetical protein
MSDAPGDTHPSIIRRRTVKELEQWKARAEAAEARVAEMDARWEELLGWRRKWISPINSEARMVLDYLDHEILDRLSTPAEVVRVTVMRDPVTNDGWMHRADGRNYLDGYNDGDALYLVKPGGDL